MHRSGQNESNLSSWLDLIKKKKNIAKLCKVYSKNTPKINNVFSYWLCCQGDPGNDGDEGEVGLPGFYGEAGDLGRQGETGVQIKPDTLYLLIWWTPKL